MTSNADSKILFEQIKKLGDCLKECNNGLKNMIKNAGKIEIKNISAEDENEVSNLKEINKKYDKDVTSTIENMKNSLKENFENLKHLEEYLRQKNEKKYAYEEKHKNLRILNKVYDDIKKEIDQRIENSINESKTINNNIIEQTNNLYDDYEDVLESSLSLPRNNYMKSSTDTIFLTVENLASSLLSSYAFHVNTQTIQNEVESLLSKK